MARKLMVAYVVIALSVVAPLIATAGMPSVLPSDLQVRWEQSAESRMRLEAISFFLIGLVVAVLTVKVLWNALASNFSRLPKIDFLRAAAIVALWGLIFTLVLTMISGARELMTPGAWKQNGFTYELRRERNAEWEGSTRVSELDSVAGQVESP